MNTAEFSCSSCGQPLKTAPDNPGLVVSCAACGAQSKTPSSAEQVSTSSFQSQDQTLQTSPSSHVCAVCCASIDDADAKTTCPNCKSLYHLECWNENGGCGVYGCSQAPAVEARRSIEIPISYWGQENKPCPSCGREILAAAVRCRHCGATFSSARPQEAAEFQKQTALEERLPKLRKTVIWLFILCLVPLSAPVGAVWGLIWYPSNKEDLKALPSLYPALCKIGIGVASVQTILLVIMTLLFSLFRGSE